MNFSKGFSASYYGMYVDPVTWRDVERFEITSGSLSESDSDLISSADLQVTDWQGGERWIRIYLDARQGQSAQRVPMFTGLATSPAKDIDGVRKTYKIECYSVLKPAADILLQRGWYAPAGISGALLVKRLLSGLAPVIEGENAPALTSAIVAEDGESNLSMAHKILRAINWRLWLLGDGTIMILPQAKDVSATFDAVKNDIVEPSISYEDDWYDCPNVFRAVADDLSATARDDSPASPFSTVRRGREIWMEETSCDLADDENIAEYALRRLKEEQKKSVKIGYNRRYDPNIAAGDLVRLHYPAQGIDGIFKVTSQKTDMSYGAKTSEEVKST